MTVTISTALIPTIAPGNLFTRLTNDDSLNVRWITAIEPVFYAIANRPIADLTVRQLAIAKSVDTLNTSIGKQSLYPFLVQPVITSGLTQVDVPISLIWDMQMSVPAKWNDVRLAKIQRISGTNDTYNGKLRLIFTANDTDSTLETSLFKVDYQIDSSLTYQIVQLEPIESTDGETLYIDPGEIETIAGYAVFKTLDSSDEAVSDFYDLLAPPTDTTDGNSDGIYDNPSSYDIADTPTGGTAVTDDFDIQSVNHGTGLLAKSAWASIPYLNSDPQSWITSMNYPFNGTANRTSTDGIEIPNGIFREFDICAPAGDEATDETSPTYFPVWIRRIERTTSTSQKLIFYFATHNVTDTEAGGSPSMDIIEFATLEILDTASSGDIIAIKPYYNLLNQGVTAGFQQGFGRGHVVLSSIWDSTPDVIEDFFAAFDTIVDNPVDSTFSMSSTRISSFAVSRVPKYIPTVGQSRALLGSTSRLDVPIPPSYDNRYVTELDQGLGSTVDLENVSGIDSHVAIERYGYTGSLCHRVVKMVVDASSLGSGSTVYQDEILPRLRALYGRDPIFGDVWYDGARFKTYNGDAWIG